MLSCLCTVKQNLPTFLGVFLSVIYLWPDKVVPVHAMEACGGVGVQFHSFLTLALDESEWSASQPGHFTLKERNPSTC